MKLNTHLEKNIEDLLHYSKETTIEEIVKTVFETILKNKRSEFLRSNKIFGNKANGYYTRLAKAVNKYLQFKIPRDRLNFFKPIFW